MKKPTYRLSWNDGRATVIYPKAVNAADALQLAIKGCPTSLLPGTTVRVQTLSPTGAVEVTEDVVIPLVPVAVAS